MLGLFLLLACQGKQSRVHIDRDGAAVIALLIGAGVTHLVGVNRVAKIRATTMKLTGLNASVELYQLGCGRLTTQAQGLRALLEKPMPAPVPAQGMRQVKSEASLIDAWGNPFEYRTPGPEGLPTKYSPLGLMGSKAAMIFDGEDPQMSSLSSILPGKGITGVVLGMTQTEVRAVLGNPSEMSTDTFDDGSDWISLDYEDQGLSCGFSSDDNYVLDLIRVERPDMQLFGREIAGLTSEEGVALFAANGEEPESLPFEQEDEAGVTYLTYDFDGVSIWFVDDRLCMVQIAPRWRDDDTPIFPHSS